MCVRACVRACVCVVSQLVFGLLSEDRAWWLEVLVVQGTSYELRDLIPGSAYGLSICSVLAADASQAVHREFHTRKEHTHTHSHSSTFTWVPVIIFFVSWWYSIVYFFDADWRIVSMFISYLDNFWPFLKTYLNVLWIPQYLLNRKSNWYDNC